jgi:2'-hydroxyisoflavone reductase
MKLLILGGTKFLGRHLVESGLSRGHEITLFTRGKTEPDLFPQVEHIRGDRDGKLDGLAGRSWDAVIDTSGYVPRVVRQSAELLKEQVKQYLFVSSVSVYANFAEPGMDEDAPLAKLEDETTEDAAAHYGGLKALCEATVRSIFGMDRTIIVRPGLIVGPYDPTDRFTYWPVRMDRGGAVLAPGTPGRPVQIIDARDLADWMIHLAEQRLSGIYNAVGPQTALSMEELLLACESPSGTQLEWVDEEFLLKEEVKEWKELPLWLPASIGWDGFLAVNGKKAQQAGLSCRPVKETARDTLQWFKSRPDKDLETPLKAGMDGEKERSLLQKWGSRL